MRSACLENCFAAPPSAAAIQRELGPGDVVHIPVGVPHQLVLPEGESFLYDLTKFNEEPLESP